MIKFCRSNIYIIVFLAISAIITILYREEIWSGHKLNNYNNVSENKYSFFVVLIIIDLLYSIICYALNQYFCSNILTIILVIFICGHIDIKNKAIRKNEQYTISKK